MKGPFRFFEDSAGAVRGVVSEIKKNTEEAIEKALRLKKLEHRASWVGWKIIHIDKERFALVMKEFEHERYPLSGSIGIEEVQRFIQQLEGQKYF